MRHVLVCFGLVSISLLLIMPLTGCSDISMRTVCMDGVSYYTNGHKLAPAYNRDGTLKLCE